MAAVWFRPLIIASLLLQGCATTPRASVEPQEVPQTVGQQPTTHEGASEATAGLSPDQGDLPRSLPTACVGSKPCTMPGDFAERLCQGTHPEVAMHMLAPGSPWQRVYVRRAFKAWHVGGRGEMRDLRAGEEVLITRQGGNSGSADLGGRAFDVLRWDGTCVSLMEDEISFQKPAAAVPANIVFTRLAPAFQTYLSEDKPVSSLLSNQKRLCEDPKSSKEPAKTKCELARRQLSQGIARVVSSGRPLPQLSFVP